MTCLRHLRSRLCRAVATAGGMSPVVDTGIANGLKGRWNFGGIRRKPFELPSEMKQKEIAENFQERLTVV